MTLETRRARNTADTPGRVRIQVWLVDARGIHIKGNIVRAATIRNTTVSRVWRKVERGLREDVP